ncbi:unnamed protein product [Allacma fusca]|uniref:Uncharacterized protein n=1 Tax=Allacma fusca TaxID=39272 RepID=A0A8J2KMP0_9HEXA|nr:unnamed protein product [Allacma fusca]
MATQEEASIILVSSLGGVEILMPASGSSYRSLRSFILGAPVEALLFPSSCPTQARKGQSDSITIKPQRRSIGSSPPRDEADSGDTSKYYDDSPAFPASSASGTRLIDHL